MAGSQRPRICRLMDLDKLLLGLIEGPQIRLARINPEFRTPRQ